MPITPGIASPSVVVIGASAGGVTALTTLVGALPGDFPAPIVVVLHRTPTSESRIVEILGRRSFLPVMDARASEPLVAGVVYISRPDQHLTVTPERRFAYSSGRPIHHVLSSANPLFTSAAAVYGPGTIAVVLSGAGRDGTDGAQDVKAVGGIVIAQDQHTAHHFGMPSSAIASGAVDYVLPIEDIAPTLVRFAQRSAERAP